MNSDYLHCYDSNWMSTPLISLDSQLIFTHRLVWYFDANVVGNVHIAFHVFVIIVTKQNTRDDSLAEIFSNALTCSVVISVHLAPISQADHRLPNFLLISTIEQARFLLMRGGVAAFHGATDVTLTRSVIESGLIWRDESVIEISQSVTKKRRRK